MFEALARLADRRAKRVVFCAIVFFLVSGVVGATVIQSLDPYGADDPDTESVRANEVLDRAGYSAVSVIVMIDAAPRTQSGRTRVAEIAKRVEANPQVVDVIGFRETRNPDLVSMDGRRTYLAVTLLPDDDKERQAAAASIADDLAGDDDVLIGGYSMAEEQVNHQVESDLQKAELIAFPILFLLALLFFRGLVAALLPMMVGGLSIVGTFLMLKLFGEAMSISIYALNIATGLGLGLAIDYSLFMVSRYREEIAISGPGPAAMRRTMATAGRTVFYSGLTVAVAMAALLIFPQRFLYSMGVGGVSVALLSATMALTVLPAVLTLLGHRVNALSPRFLARRAERETKATEEGFWYRLSRFVMRRPVPVATFSALLLIILGLPFLGIKFTGVDAQVLPESTSAHQVDDILTGEFLPHRDSPVRVVMKGATPSQVTEQIENLNLIPEIDAVGPPVEISDQVTMIEAYSKGDYLSETSKTAVRVARDIPAPNGTQTWVTGGTASLLDFQQSMVNHLPVAVLWILISTLVILFLMTGSVILPFKALLMNVLNLSAVFGILVLIFQDGRLEGLLNYSSQGAIEQSMPILLFAAAFGLSTDYAVFLLSRIKEARDLGASERECVAIGLERTGRIVTAAAVLFAIAMGAFAISEIIFIKQTGLGIALAVLIDASIVRALLVPSLMELLGKWNWWAPGPLRRLHDRFGISEGDSFPEGDAA